MLLPKPAAADLPPGRFLSECLRLPLMGFQRSPLCRSSVGWCRVDHIAVFSLRPTAAMLPALPLMPFQRLQRTSPIPQSADASTDIADSGVQAVSPPRLLASGFPTCLTLRSVPLLLTVASLTRPPASWLSLHRMRIPSRRWSAYPASLLDLAMSPCPPLTARGPLSATSGCCDEE